MNVFRVVQRKLVELTWLGAALLVPSLPTALYFVWLIDYPPQIRQTSYLIGKLL